MYFAGLIVCTVSGHCEHGWHCPGKSGATLSTWFTYNCNLDYSILISPWI